MANWKKAELRVSPPPKDWTLKQREYRAEIRVSGKRVQWYLRWQSKGGGIDISIQNDECLDVESAKAAVEQTIAEFTARGFLPNGQIADDAVHDAEHNEG